MQDAPGPTHAPHGDWRQAPPQGNPSEERTYAWLAHLSALAGLIIPLGSVVGPLVVWLLGREKGPFADHHGKEALNFQILVLLVELVLGAVLFVSMVLAFLVLPILLIVLAGIGLAAVAIVAVVLAIIATVEANKGNWYRYPISARFIQ